MQVRLLGPIEVVSTSGAGIAIPGAKMRGLLALLALETGSAISPERLIDALWGEQPVNGTNALQVTVSKLRRLLGAHDDADRIVTKPSGYLLDVERDHVDALRFEALADGAHAAASEPSAVAAALTAALGLWHGPALADAPDTEVTAALRTRLEELRRVAVEDLVDAELALGHHRRLAAELEALVAADPLRERRWGQLMRALYGAGQQADALRAFQRARDTLVDELGIEPGPDLRRLEAAILAHDDAAMGNTPGPAIGPVGDGFRRRGNARHPVGPCIGRDRELARLDALIGEQRFVTLVGPGGVGKTRLALELCTQLRARVAGGVWWIDLVAARDESDAIAALQRSLRLEPTGGADAVDAIIAIADALGDTEAILVFDNCEHLLDSVTTIVEELLGRCVNITVVATSRQGLGGVGELLVEVAPLVIADAITLFEARIAGRTIAEDQQDEIAAICERLDRLPLALELAAARTRHLALDEILARLTDRFELLRDGSRTGAARRDLRSVTDWSYELLDDLERVVFERLSVFSDGAIRGAARVVCATDKVAADDVEQVIERLIDKSLVVADHSGAHTRYRMLQTLFEYARERLDERGDTEDAHRAHARWVHEVASTVQFGAHPNGSVVADVQDEDVAIRDAIEWASTEDPLLALEIAVMLAPFWFGTMRASVGWELLAAALDACGDRNRELRASALAWAVVFSTMAHDVASAVRMGDEALAVETVIGDPERLGRIHLGLALAAGYRGGDASDWIDSARRHFTTSDSDTGLGYVNFADGAVRLLVGDLDGAASSLHDAIDAFRDAPDHLGSVLAVSRLGELAWRLGDVDLFAEMHAELVELGRASRSDGVVTGATARLALAHLQRGATFDAQELARAALASSSESFMPVVNGYAFKTAGLVNLHLGHVPEAHEQLHAAIDAFERGTGTVGLGLAASCWVDLSRSFSELAETAAARDAAERAVEVATASADPWIQDQARAQLALIA